MVPFLQDFPPESHVNLFSTSYVLDAPPIALMVSPKQYLVSSTNKKGRHIAVFSGLLLLPSGPNNHKSFSALKVRDQVLNPYKTHANKKADSRNTSSRIEVLASVPRL